jgi:putative transposase
MFERVPQPRRIPGTTGPFHVTARGNRGQAIFMDNGDRARFLELLTQIARESSWMLHAYCLMTNHYHLVLESPVGKLSAGMQRLNAGYAQWFNRRHDLAGHLFRHRFYAGLVSGDSHLVELMRYLALNPIRGGLCTSPEDWRWSSYGQLVSRAAGPLLSDRALSYFGRDEQLARDALRDFVGDHA